MIWEGLLVLSLRDALRWRWNDAWQSENVWSQFKKIFPFTHFFFKYSDILKMISILFIGLYLVTFQVTCEGAPGPKIIIQNDVEKRASEYISILAYIYTSWLIEPSLKLLWVKWQDLNYKFLIGGKPSGFFSFSLEGNWALSDYLTKKSRELSYHRVCLALAPFVFHVFLIRKRWFAVYIFLQFVLKTKWTKVVAVHSGKAKDFVLRIVNTINLWWETATQVVAVASVSKIIF